MLKTYKIMKKEMNMSQLDYLRIYKDFWQNIIEDKFGLPNYDQIKKELADYYLLIYEVPKVYNHATGGKIQTSFKLSEDVIKEIENYYNHEFAFKMIKIINDIKYEMSQEVDYDKIDGMDIAIEVIRKHIRELGK
jgi:hypothetical protein